jgi:hypothetical protein
MPKQTAVEWLYEQIIVRRNGIDNSIPLTELLEQALEMEWQQIIDAFDECGNWQDNYSDSEHYYNETYKKPLK